jgi:multiple sugar transport system permease protein
MTTPLSTDPSKIVPEGLMKLRIENFFKSIFFYVGVLLVILWCIFPFLWAIIQSFVDPSKRSLTAEYIPSNPTLFNYDVVFSVFQFQKYIINSAYISILTTVICVLIAAFTAYVLAQFNFRFKEVIMLLILSMTMFPGIIIAVPLYNQYIIFKNITGIQLVNTYIPGLLIPYISLNLPLTVFLLFNFFQEIPKELILAARVDGASNFQVFRKVILPLAIPGVFTTSILVFIAAWNEFLFASIFMNLSNGTIPLALSLFNGIPTTGGATYDAFLSLMAACVIVTIPLVIVVLIFQKQIVSGITAGAVKG